MVAGNASKYMQVCQHIVARAARRRHAFGVLSEAKRARLNVRSDLGYDCAMPSITETTTIPSLVASCIPGADFTSGHKLIG